jgi:cytochrome d ubiquinol oxidase subunit I
MILAAYLVTGFCVAAVHAAALLRGRDIEHHRRALSLALWMGVSLIPIQFGVGHWSAQVVAATQPVKLAAMEGQFASEKSAPLRIGGWPDEESRTTRYAIEIPGGLSWLAYEDSGAVVRGLDDFPRDETPPVRVVHIAFQLMVAAGSGLLAMALVTGWSLWRRREIPRTRRYYGAVVACGPLVLLALETGWVVTEVGRQPWIVNGVMRTRDAVTAAPGIGTVLFVTLTIYAVLTIGAAGVLRLLARVPLGGTIDGH